MNFIFNEWILDSFHFNSCYAAASGINILNCRNVFIDPIRYGAFSLTKWRNFNLQLILYLLKVQYGTTNTIFMHAYVSRHFCQRTQCKNIVAKYYSDHVRYFVDVRQKLKCLRKNKYFAIKPINQSINLIKQSTNIYS